MSLGKTVVTTSVGAAGINYSDGKNLLIADTPQQFLSQIKKCIDYPDFCQSIGESARNLILEEYGNKTLTLRLVDFYNKIGVGALK